MFIVNFIKFSTCTVVVTLATTTIMSPIAKRRRTDMDENSENENALRQAQRKHAAAQHRTKLTAQAVGEMYSYKSNVFRMETEEMLNEVAFNYGSKRVAAVEQTLHRLKDLIDAVPERKGLKVRSFATIGFWDYEGADGGSRLEKLKQK